jgi:hypothetical protein
MSATWLAEAVKEAEDRPVRAVIIVGDAFHDVPVGPDEAAICANRLRRAGTRVFLGQLCDDLITARRLQYSRYGVKGCLCVKPHTTLNSRSPSFKFLQKNSTAAAAEVPALNRIFLTFAPVVE